MKAIALVGLLLFIILAHAESIVPLATAPSAAKTSPATNAPAVEPNKITLKVVKADSEETAGEDGKAAR